MNTQTLADAVIHQSTIRSVSGLRAKQQGGKVHIKLVTILVITLLLVYSLGIAHSSPLL